MDRDLIGFNAFYMMSNKLNAILSSCLTSASCDVKPNFEIVENYIGLSKNKYLCQKPAKLASKVAVNNHWLGSSC